ncbi:MAG TPA: ABC transporter ATP-binding protein [Thermoanaerobaculia bacterium]|nr:ABC transporter ATP-binding protein [Thermoanaerobaculia bacterium]
MPALRIRGLRKTYGNGVEALKGIDLDVEAGDFFGLLGPNGAGKSTAIGIVSSLVNKTGGTVEVFGVDLDADRVAAKRLIGLVPQEVNFNQFERPDQIVAQQAGYYGVPWARAKARAEECLHAMGLWEKRDQAARELSGGMKRRLMIARALVHKPRLLILDEPTAGVDIELRRTTWRLMEEINRDGTTVILTTHYLEEAESLCRRIAIIDRGTIIENTDTKSLLAKLSVETFVIDPSEPLRELPPIDSYPARLRPDGSLEVDVARGQGLNHLFRQLEARNIAVASMRNKANRLEELFVRMVEGDNRTANDRAAAS